MNQHTRICMAALSFALGSACREDEASRPETFCTLIGCASGLYVSVVPAPTEAYSVVVFDNETDSTRVVRCDPPTSCPTQLAFYDYMPANVVLRVVSASGGSLEREIRPVYEPQYPNGRRCGEACRTARVTIPWTNMHAPVTRID